MLRLVERLVARGGPSAAAAALRRGQRLILAYHNIVPDADAVVGERTLHLPLERFCEQLDALQRSHTIVSLAELIDPPRRSQRPLAAITFDDAYRGCVTLGLPELERRGLPSTVFVAPGLVGSPGCWWDRLASPVSGTLPAEARLHMLGALRGDADEAIRWAREHGIAEHALPHIYGIATEMELGQAVRLRGVRLGVHSWTHRSLATLDGADLDRELREPLAWLRARFDDVMPWLAFPYGAHNAETVTRALDADYAAVLRISGGWTTAAAVASHNLPRLNIGSGLSTDRFMLKTRGVVPI